MTASYSILPHELLTGLVKTFLFVSNGTLGRVQHKMPRSTNSLVFGNMNAWVLIQENLPAASLHASAGPPFTLVWKAHLWKVLLCRNKAVRHLGGADTTET